MDAKQAKEEKDGQQLKDLASLLLGAKRWGLSAQKTKLNKQQKKG